jgi:hypothetical protein
MLLETEPNFSFSLLTHLNAERHRTVALTDEHTLILTGAGAGKTRVLRIGNSTARAEI